MNAAAKALTQHISSQGFAISREAMIAFLFLAMVLASAMSVIYVKNSQRCMSVEMQRLHNHENQLEVEWGQLILEHGALTAPARLEQIAQEQLHLKLPSSQEIVMVEQ